MRTGLVPFASSGISEFFAALQQLAQLSLIVGAAHHLIWEPPHPLAFPLASHCRAPVLSEQFAAERSPAPRCGFGFSLCPVSCVCCDDSGWS